VDVYRLGFNYLVLKCNLIWRQSIMFGIIKSFVFVHSYMLKTQIKGTDSRACTAIDSKYCRLWTELNER
jgi:hypothetical protein